MCWSQGEIIPSLVRACDVTHSHCLLPAPAGRSRLQWWEWESVTSLELSVGCLREETESEVRCQPSTAKYRRPNLHLSLDLFTKSVSLSYRQIQDTAVLPRSKDYFSLVWSSNSIQNKRDNVYRTLDPSAYVWLIIVPNSEELEIILICWFDARKDTRCHTFLPDPNCWVTDQLGRVARAVVRWLRRWCEQVENQEAVANVEFTNRPNCLLISGRCWTVWVLWWHVGGEGP